MKKHLRKKKTLFSMKWILMPSTIILGRKSLRLKLHHFIAMPLKMKVLPRLGCGHQNLVAPQLDLKCHLHCLQYKVWDNSLFRLLCPGVTAVQNFQLITLIYLKFGGLLYSRRSNHITTVTLIQWLIELLAWPKKQCPMNNI